MVGGIFLWNYFQNLSTEEVSDEIDLPNFVGKIYETEIKDNPEYADLEFEITMGNVPSKAAGEVLRQTPAAGMKVKKGKTISLTVNGELEKVVVEETKGDKQQDAYNKLKALGLNPEIQAVADDETAVGYVVKTNPAAGTEVTTGTKITIFVSSGPSKEKVKVPQVVGSTLATAKRDLEASGFVIGDIRYDDESDKDEGTVLSCDPKSGDEAPKGSAVNLVVSSGKGATKTVQYDIPLPSNVYEDLVMKIYVDGELFDTRTVNPSVSMYTGASFSGTGRASLTIRLNDQDYISAEINYDTQSIDVYSQLPYTTPEPAPTDPPEEPESGTDEPDDGQITTH